MAESELPTRRGNEMWLLFNALSVRSAPSPIVVSLSDVLRMDSSPEVPIEPHEAQALQSWDEQRANSRKTKTVYY